MAVATAVVLAALVASTWVSAAAVFALLAGAISSRIVYAEVTQTRRAAGIDRSTQARDFGAAMTRMYHEHATFTAAMTSRLESHDKTIVELASTIRLAFKRAHDAQARVQIEAERADNVQARLSALLDDVLTSRSDALVGVGVPEAAGLPTIADLLSWDNRADRDDPVTAEQLRSPA